MEAQSTLREEIKKNEQEKIKQVFQSIINEGGPKSQAFWKARRRIMKSNQVPDYDTIDETGNTITNPGSSKEHIATYFENLYQAREANPLYKAS